MWLKISFKLKKNNNPLRQENSQLYNIWKIYDKILIL